MNALEAEIERISCSHWGLWPASEATESRAPVDNPPGAALSKDGEVRDLPYIESPPIYQKLKFPRID